MDTETKVRRREATVVLSLRRHVRLSEIGAVISQAFGEIYGYLGRHRARSPEPPFIIYHGAPGPADHPFEIEICSPIRRAIDPPEGWQLTELPEGLFASVLHVGPYDTLGETYDHLAGWIASHGYAMAGPPREVYLSEPSVAPEAIRTVVEFPILEARQPAITSR